MVTVVDHLFFMAIPPGGEEIIDCFLSVMPRRAFTGISFWRVCLLLSLTVNSLKIVTLYLFEINLKPSMEISFFDSVLPSFR